MSKRKSGPRKRTAKSESCATKIIYILAHTTDIARLMSGGD